MSNEIITPTTIRAEATRILGRCGISRDITPEAEFAAARAHNETRSLQDLGIIAASKTIYDGHCMVSNLDYAKNAFVFSWADGEVDCLDYPLGTYPFQSALIKILRRKGENIRDEVTIITTPEDTPQYWLGQIERISSKVGTIPVWLPNDAPGENKMCWLHPIRSSADGTCTARWPREFAGRYAMPRNSYPRMMCGEIPDSGTVSMDFQNFMVLRHRGQWHIFCDRETIKDVQKFEAVVLRFIKCKECLEAVFY